jgi:hypothetical protein
MDAEWGSKLSAATDGLNAVVVKGRLRVPHCKQHIAKDEIECFDMGVASP